MIAANTRDCFSEFIGQKVVGVIFDALPRTSFISTKTLIFEDGRGLTTASNGSYWIDSAFDVSRAVQIVRDELAAAEKRLRGVLNLAGNNDLPVNCPYVLDHGNCNMCEKTTDGECSVKKALTDDSEPGWMAPPTWHGGV